MLCYKASQQESVYQQDQHRHPAYKGEWQVTADQCFQAKGYTVGKPATIQVILVTDIQGTPNRSWGVTDGGNRVVLILKDFGKVQGIRVDRFRLGPKQSRRYIGYDNQ